MRAPYFNPIPRYKPRPSRCKRFRSDRYRRISLGHPHPIDANAASVLSASVSCNSPEGLLSTRHRDRIWSGPAIHDTVPVGTQWRSIGHVICEGGDTARGTLSKWSRSTFAWPVRS